MRCSRNAIEKGLSLTVDVAWCNRRVYPQNTAVIAGQMMGIECRAQNGSVVREWSLLRSSPGENHRLQQQMNDEKIFSNWNSETRPTHSSQFSIDVDQYGSGRLYSNSTTLEDAGLYSCVVETGHELTRSSAELIVLESTPVCETNLNISTGNSFMKGDRIWMRCSVRFRGYWTPSMEWRQHGKDKDGWIMSADEVLENENFYVTSMISITFNSSTNYSFFACKTYFSTQKHRRHANATNAPDFVYCWNSSVIKQTNSANVIDNPTPLATTPLDTGFNSSINLYFVSLTAVGTLATFLCVVTTILCIRMKRKSSDPVTMPAKEVDRPISSDDTAVSRSSSSLYDAIDDETTMPMPTQDTSSIHGGEKSDPMSLCKVIHQIPAIDIGYENAEICASNQPSQAVLTLPIPDAEFPEENCPPDILQDNFDCEDVSYIRVVGQVREPAPYESLQPSSARDPSHHQAEVEA